MNFEEYLDSLRDKTVAVIGIGVSNQPLIQLLLSRGIRVTACDKKNREALGIVAEQLEANGCSLRLGEGYLDGLTEDVIFRTPGMRPDLPQFTAAVKRGSILTSEMEVFFEVCPCPKIAVTGSDGKTTTTTIIAELLKRAGKTVHLGGNIGHPLLAETGTMKPEDIAVLELSSFQLMTMTASPHIAVITNLAPNHLDVHKDMEEYVQAKKNIFHFQKPGDLLVLNADNEITASFAGAGQTHFFSRKGRTNCVWEENGAIYRRGEKILETADILIPGTHNVENYMAAIAAVDGLVSDDTIRQVARNFGGVEHRIELVRIKDGVKFYNDSIASSPSRTIAGLRSFTQKVILIAGGYDKHIPYEVLGPEICLHVSRLFLCGATAGKIRAAVEQAEQPDKPEITDCGDFESAVRRAAAAAKPGDIVLMSPASASFDQFKNFMVRGDCFKKIVKEL